MTDSHEFESLLERHWGIVRKVAGVYARTPDAREDLAQEICLQLWRSFDRYDRTRSFSTWMYRVALNTGISYARRARLRSTDEVPLQQVPAASSAESFDDRVDELYRFIHGQDELTRALVLLYLEDRPHKEIAEILGISETNVSTRLSRFRDLARRTLAETTSVEGDSEHEAR